jgi:DNA polymerase V
MTRPIYALVDCNNFYASCERVFRPELENVPIVVLSNNDGCIVARSAEVKRLKIPNGSPLFKVKHLIDKHGVRVFSSNYTLYADLSGRVMNILGTYTPELEIYSIDEAFLDLSGMEHVDLVEYGRDIKRIIRQWTGIPVCVGIAPTKTLAKLANRVAKKFPKFGGVFDITDHPKIDQILEHVEVADVWGVGRRHERMLLKMGVANARQLRDLDEDWVMRRMTVVGWKMVRELKGIPCYEMEDQPEPKQGIITSKSFGHPVESLEDLREAVASYTARAAEKLRSQGSVVSHLTLFITTNPYSKEAPQYARSATASLDPPTAYTPELTSAAIDLLERMYRPGYFYKKAGVMLTGIISDRELNYDAFRPAYTDGPQQRVMEALDEVNRRYGSNTLKYGTMGFDHAWRMNQNSLSPKYTTSWDELPKVKA